MDDQPDDTTDGTLSVRWREGGRFGMTPAWVLHHPALSSHSVRLYGVMALRASWDDGTLTISQRDLGDSMGVSVSTVKRALAGLEKAGVIESHGRYDEAHGRGWNEYSLAWNPPATGEPTPQVTGDLSPGSRVSEPIQTPSDDTEIPNRDLYWDHLEGVFGYRAVGPEAALWGKIIKTVIGAGDPPGEIPRRALIWAYHYSTPLTPATLLQKWRWLGGKTAAVTDADRVQLRAMLNQKAGENAYWAAINEGRPPTHLTEGDDE